MAGTLTNGSVRVTLNGTYSEALASGGVIRTTSLPSSAVGANGANAGISTDTFTNGTSNGMANVLVSISGSVTAGSPVDIDLTAIPQGATTITLTGVKAMLAQEVSAVGVQANTLLMGDSSGTLTNAITAFWTVNTGRDIIGSQGCILKSNPYGFTVDSSHKVLRINAGVGGANYQIDILGTQ